VAVQPTSLVGHVGIRGKLAARAAIESDRFRQDRTSETLLTCPQAIGHAKYEPEETCARDIALPSAFGLSMVTFSSAEGQRW
jgi:hypothetical protein